MKNEVNCKNLSIGMVVKNYKEMCRLLEEDETTGKSKQYQIERWKNYFDFEKQGQKFLISEIYDEPYPSVDARKLKEGIYVGYIELLLMDYLLSQKDYTAYLIKQKLYEITGMISKKYNEQRCQYQNISNSVETNYQYPVSKSDIKSFYSRTDHKLNAIVTSALKSMANRFLINYSTEYVICFIDPLTTDWNSNPIKQFRIANDSEVEMILQAQRATIEYLNCNSFSQVLLKGEIENYFNYLDYYVNNKYGWEYVYSQIKIVYLNDAIKKQIPIKAEEIRKLSKKDKQIGLNKEVIKALDKQAENKYLKYERERPKYQPISEEEYNELFANDTQELDDLFIDEQETPPKYSINYVEIQRRLADYLIKINDNDKFSPLTKNDNEIRKED